MGLGGHTRPPLHVFGLNIIVQASMIFRVISE
jgi:hypothetical protein